MMTAIAGGVVGGLVALAVPSILSGTCAVIRPLVKEMVKGGIVAYTTVSDMVSAVGGECTDLVEEAKSEAQGEEAKPTLSKKSQPGEQRG